MNWLKRALPWLAFLGLSSCAVTVHNLEGCSGVNGFAGVGALCQNTLSDDHRDLTPEEWLDFLYARPRLRVPDPKDPTKMVWLDQKGPAVCFSSVDFQKQKTALEQLCVKAKCNYETKQLVDETVRRMSDLQNRTESASGF